MTRILHFEDIQAGDAIPELRKVMSIVRNVMYAAATWDFHRIHYDTELVQSRGFPKPFADGQIFGAFLAQMATNWMGAEGSLKKLKLSYRAMVFLGDVVTCRGRVTKKESGENLVFCELWVENQKGEKIVPDATAVVSLPSRK